MLGVMVMVYWLAETITKVPTPGLLHMEACRVGGQVRSRSQAPT